MSKIVDIDGNEIEVPIRAKSTYEREFTAMKAALF